MSDEIEQRVVNEIFSASQAWENMQVLADDIGSRLAGSCGEVAARDFLVETLGLYGVDEVNVEPFPHLGWECKGEELRVVDPMHREILCRCAGLSPCCRRTRSRARFLKKVRLGRSRSAAGRD